MVPYSDFVMRIRGDRAACEEFISNLTTQEGVDICRQQGSDDDMMFEVSGSCDNTLENGMLYEDDLPGMAADLNIEFEVFAYSPEELEWVEHFHYKGSECLVYDPLDLFLYIDPDLEPDEIAEQYENFDKYQQSEDDDNVYVLKDEFKAWDYCEDRFVFHFSMIFDDLKG